MTEEYQYDACEPENRVVARTLERRWNERLAELETIEREYAALKTKQRVELSDLDRQRILQLASDLPRLWNAKSTTPRDRKMLLRNLIKDISVRAIDVPRSTLRTQIMWHTGAVTDLDIDFLRKGGRRQHPVQFQVGTTRIPEPLSQSADRR